MNTFCRKDFYRPAPAWSYFAALIVTASIWAMPITEGGSHELASWVAWAYAWATTVVGTLAIFASPMEHISEHPKVWNWLNRAASWGGVAWLIYHGHDLLPALLVYTYLIAAWHRGRAIQSAHDD